MLGGALWVNQGTPASAAVGSQSVWFDDSLAQGERFGPALRNVPSLEKRRMDGQTCWIHVVSCTRAVLGK